MNTPGAGAYGVDVKSAKSGSSFGPHQNNGKFKDDRGKALLGNVWTPGPGNYSIDKGTASKAPAYSISSKPKSKDDNWQPGPGNYNPNIDASKPDSHASAIGRGQRPDLTGVGTSK